MSSPPEATDDGRRADVTPTPDLRDRRPVSAPPRGRNPIVAWLLGIYTLVALLALPFAVTLVLFVPLIVGGEQNPRSPLVAVTQLMMFGVPLLILVAIPGSWIAWRQRRSRGVLIFTLAPIVYGIIAIGILAVL